MDPSVAELENVNLKNVFHDFKTNRLALNGVLILQLRFEIFEMRHLDFFCI